MTTKRTLTLVALLAAALTFASQAQAKPVTPQAARQAAATFLHLDADRLHALPLEWNTMYLFAIDNGGFVLTSADSRILPVLGYSLRTDALRTDGTANAAFHAWLSRYDALILAAAADDTLADHPQWPLLLAGTAPKGVYPSPAGPLVETKWDQDPYYNDLCPADDLGEKALTGCVATAMGQVMRYWQWPDAGVGAHSYSCQYFGYQSADFGATTYDWAHMPASLTAVSDSADLAAIATLLFHCGVAVDMDYGTADQYGSAAYDIMYQGDDLHTPCAENAFRTYFKYSPALAGIIRPTYSDAQWAALLKDEIDHRRPLLYGGTGPSGGHQFICDGYDTNGYFSFNWGYSGLYDGFFSLSNLVLTDAYAFAFNYYQSAVVGIQPDTLYGSATSCTVVATSTDTLRGSVSGGGTYAYRDTVTLTASPAPGFRFLRWSNGVVLNPYPLLAHDDTLQALFRGALLEEDDTLSYTGTAFYYSGRYDILPSDRMGIRIPAAALQDRHYLTAVDVYMHYVPIVVNIHFGGDDAPGPIVHSQRQQGTQSFKWQRVVLDSALAIPPDSNLWVTIQTTENDLVMGTTDIDAPDANWYSDDNGATWGHLTDYEPPYSFCDPYIAWLIRCITSSDATDPNPVAIPGVEPPTALVRIDGLSLTVDNPDGQTVSLYDIMGRHLATSRLASATIPLPAPGIYLVKINTHPAQKIVAIR